PSRRGSCRATRALRTRPCGLLGDREPRRLPSRSSPVQHEVPMTAARGILALAGVTVTLVTLLTVTWLGAESLGLTDERFLRDRLLALASDGGGRPLVALVVGLLLAADLVLPVPSSLLMTLSGFACGIVLGATASFAGAMASAWIGYF